MPTMMMGPKHEFAMVIAYVDAGSGILMLQMLGGAVLGGWFYFRRSVTRFVGRMLGRSEPPSEGKPPETESTIADAR
jgi:hypothetical protein